MKKPLASKKKSKPVTTKKAINARSKPSQAGRLSRNFARDVYVHPQATVMGDVTLGQGVSIWPGAVLRGDMNSIRIGRMVNIQDNCTLHVDSSLGLEIGEYTLVGHNCMIHSCTIGRGCLIGIGSVILEGAVIGDGAMVTAGCLVRGGRKIPPFSLVVSKNGELVVYEKKARTLLALAGCIEYSELARRVQKGKFGPFSADEEKKFYAEAQIVYAQLFGEVK